MTQTEHVHLHVWFQIFELLLLLDHENLVIWDIVTVQCDDADSVSDTQFTVRGQEMTATDHTFISKVQILIIGRSREFGHLRHRYCTMWWRWFRFWYSFYRQGSGNDRY